MKTHTIFPYAVLLLASILPTHAFAQDENVMDRMTRVGAEAADDTHDYISERVEELSLRLDAILGGDRILKESTGTYIVLRPGMRKVYNDQLLLTLDAKAQVILPKTEKKLRFEMDSRHLMDQVAGEKSKTPGAAPGEIKAPGGRKGGEKFFAGLLADLLDDDNWRLRAGGGVRVVYPPDPYLKTIVNFSKDLGSGWCMNLEEGAFWYLSEGPLARSEAEFTRKVMGNFVLSFTSAALYTRDGNTWDLGETITLLQHINVDTAIAYRVGEIWETEPNFRDVAYFVDATGRRRIHSDWLFSELRASFTWSRSEEFKPTPAMFLWVEAFFGERGVAKIRKPGGIKEARKAEIDDKTQSDAQ